MARSQPELYELTEAKSIIAYVHPFINSIMLDKLKIDVDPADEFIPTLATDGVRLLINSKYFADLKEQDFRVAALAHEILHAMLMHPDRFKHYSEHGLDGRPVSLKLLNIAADFIINDMLKQFKIGRVHKDWLWSEEVSYTDQLEDVYRRLLPPAPPPAPKNPGPNGQQGQGSAGGNKSYGHGSAQPGGEDGSNPAASEGEGDDDVTLRSRDGTHRLPVDSSKQFDHHMPGAEGPSELEWHTAVQQAMQQAKSIGRLPADMERMLSEFLTIKKRWDEELADLIKLRAGFDTRNMRRANKRRLFQDRLYLPTRHSWQIEKMAFIFDVSGSISNKECAFFMGTVYDILTQCKVKELRCLCVNSMVIEDVTFTDIEDFIAWKPHGSGGTDMEAGLRHITEDDWNPDMCIVLTDGYTTTRPENQPDYPVIWVTTADENLAYGKVIKMPVEEAEAYAA